MESKRLGDLRATLLDTEQELQSTNPTLDLKELRMARDLLRVAQSRLQKFTQY